MQKYFRQVLNVQSLLELCRITEAIRTRTLVSQTFKMDAADNNKRAAGENEELVQAKKLKTETPTRSEQGLPYKRKKVAMMMMYCGKEYMGMQRNPGCKTVESELLTALVKAGVVAEEDIDDFGKLKFQRAARTDKGVSAAGQVCSLKINVDNAVQIINGNLPEDIRVVDIKKTTRGFDSKNFATARTYIYLIPTFAFTPIEEFVVESYRITDEILKQVNETLAFFKGTHNFHNFTSKKLPTDRSATRFIMEFSIGKPFEKDGFEFAVISVKGQSFMLHHIRKMIGLTIAIVRGYTNVDVIEKCWGPEKMDIPKAPGLGLMLDRLHYDWYNKKFGNDGSHEAISLDSFKEEVNKFKEEMIFKTMIETEKEEKSMMNWLQTLPIHSYDVESGSKESAALTLLMDQRRKDKECNELEESISRTDTSEIEKTEGAKVDSIDVIEKT